METQLGKKIGVLSFFISEDENKIKLWPSTCSHEGAELSLKCIKGERIFVRGIIGFQCQ